MDSVNCGINRLAELNINSDSKMVRLRAVANSVNYKVGDRPLSRFLLFKTLLIFSKLHKKFLHP